MASLGLPIFKPVGPWVCLPSRWCTGPKTRQTLLLATEARGRCPGRVVRLVKLYIEDDGSNQSTRRLFLHKATKFKDTKLSRVIKIPTILANTFRSIDTSREAFPAMPVHHYFDQSQSQSNYVPLNVPMNDCRTHPRCKMCCFSWRILLSNKNAVGYEV